MVTVFLYGSLSTLKKLYFHFLSHWIGYDRGDSFPYTLDGIWSWWQFFFRFSEPNGIPFGSENRKEICHHDHIPFNVKGNGNIVFSVWRLQGIIYLLYIYNIFADDIFAGNNKTIRRVLTDVNQHQAQSRNHLCICIHNIYINIHKWLLDCAACWWFS